MSDEVSGGAVVYEVDPEKLLKAARECQEVADKYGEIVAHCRNRPLPSDGMPPIAAVVLTVLGQVVDRFIASGTEGREQFTKLSERMADAAQRYQEADRAAGDAYDRVGDDEDRYDYEDRMADVDPDARDDQADDADAEADDTENDELEKENDELEQENDELEQENDKLEQENDKLEQENDELEQENDKLEQENDKLQEQLDLLTKRDELLARIPALRERMAAIDEENESWEKRLEVDGMETAFDAYLVHNTKAPEPDLASQHQSLEDRIEAYYERADELDGVDPQTTDPAQVSRLQALADEGEAIEKEYADLQEKILYAEQFRSAEGIEGGDTIDLLARRDTHPWGLGIARALGRAAGTVEIDGEEIDYIGKEGITQEDFDSRNYWEVRDEQGNVIGFRLRT